MNQFSPEHDLAERDARDPLARFRIRHQMPRGMVHLAGAALGVMPRILPTRLSELVEEEWGLDLLAGWERHGWRDYPQLLGERMASLLGAGPGQVVAGAGLGTVLPVILAAHPERRRIVIPPGAVIPGLLDWVNVNLARFGYHLDAGMADTATALLVAPAVGLDGAVIDIPALARQAQAVGAMSMLAAGRAVGLVPLALDAGAIDAAFGGGAGYLCGGPGAAGFAYLAARHGGAGCLTSEANPLALAVLEVGVALVGDADLAHCWRKAQELTALFRRMVPGLHGGAGAVELFLPCPDPQAAAAELLAAGVIAEPAPAGLCFSFAPLVLSYAEVALAAERVRAWLNG